MAAAWLDTALTTLDTHIEPLRPTFTNGNGHDATSVLQPGQDPTAADVFCEEPVPLDVFVSDKLFLSSAKLSDEQFRLVALAETVYFPQTYTILPDWWYTQESWWRPGYTEITAEWGKGSGKDYCARIISARVAYLVQCLNDPFKYYSHDPSSSIDLLNVARSTKQANDVFFEPLKRMIGRSPWFSDKAEPRIGQIRFPKNVYAHSGHADQESLEGFNLLIGVADEIAAFKTKEETRNRQSPRPGQHSADAIADMMRSSGQSRFPGLAKVVYISYPRFRGDFIEQKYEQSLREPTAYASKRATWEVNPTKTREMFEDEYRKDPEGAAAKYECKPPQATNKYFRNDKAIDLAFQRRVEPPVDDLGFLMPEARFDHGKAIAIHMDLALTRDRCAICACHMQDWSVRTTADGHILRQPIVFVDLVTSFSARELGLKEVDLDIAESLVIEMMNRGALVSLVTADQFQSAHVLQHLSRRTEVRKRSVDRDTSAYDVTKSTIYQGRLIAYFRERLITELKGVKLINGIKVDHEPGSSKDEADALAGAVAGVHELAHEAIGHEITGDRLDWANPDSTWHDPARGRGPWDRTANFAAVGTPGNIGRGALRAP
jgi:hypothetical protein